MNEISNETVEAAKGGDLTATQEIIAATEDAVRSVARDLAGRVTDGGNEWSTLVEELESVGRCAVWEAVTRWDAKAGESTSFRFFAYKTIKGEVNKAFQSDFNAGADRDALMVFRQCLKVAGGDPYLAERLTQTLPEKGRRLGPDRAEAARLAHMGGISLDAPAPGEDAGTLADTIADKLVSFDVPDDLVTTADLNQADRKARHALVHAVLDTLSPLRRAVLLTRAENGHGDALEMSPEDVAALAQNYAGVTERPTRLAVNDAWRKGTKQFADRFPIDVVYA